MALGTIPTPGESRKFDTSPTRLKSTRRSKVAGMGNWNEAGIGYLSGPKNGYRTSRNWETFILR